MVYRTSGLAYHEHKDKEWHVTHLLSGARTWRDFTTEEDAKLYILGMVNLAKELNFSWHRPLNEIAALFEMGSREAKERCDDAFEALKAEKQAA
jgi:hypothetical protein